MKVSETTKNYIHDSLVERILSTPEAQELKNKAKTKRTEWDSLVNELRTKWTNELHERAKEYGWRIEHLSLPSISMPYSSAPIAEECAVYEEYQREANRKARLAAAKIIVALELGTAPKNSLDQLINDADLN